MSGTGKKRGPYKRKAEPPPPPGYTRLLLEERLQPTEPFVPSLFSHHAARVQYVPAAGDEELLRAAGPLSFDMPTEAHHPTMLASSRPDAHPLLCMRPDFVVPREKKRGRWYRRNCSIAMPHRLPLEARSGTGGGPVAGAVLLRVALFHHEKKAREFEVHADTTLYELRKVLTCKTQAEINFQVRELQKRDAAFAAARPPPSDSAAFCIEDQWFVSGPEDLSLEARRDAAAAGRQMLGPTRMLNATFGAVRLRLGAPYLFAHHGDCEHTIVFTRCSLLSEPEAACGYSYPRLVWERHSPQIICTTCCRERAVWDVHDDVYADINPCKLCQVCHYQFHYTEAGVATYTGYKIYPILVETEDVIDEQAEEERAIAEQAEEERADGLPPQPLLLPPPQPPTPPQQPLLLPPPPRAAEAAAATEAPATEVAADPDAPPSLILR